MRWGIDLGGTKIEGVVLEDANPKALCRIRIATEAAKGYEHILRQIETLVDQMETDTGLKRTKIGLGTPGISDLATGLMKNSNSTALNGRPLATDLAERLKCEVKLANDANCFALAEARFGAGAGANSVFGVIMGTGVGGGIVIGGQPHEGSQGIAGEWGHNELEPGGASCYCGKRGCVETVLSGPALERFYLGQTSRNRSLGQIVDLARSGEEPSAVETLDRLVTNFGKGAFCRREHSRSGSDRARRWSWKYR